MFSQWIRKNLVLVSGIVLPVLLVLGFLVLQGAPRVLGEPPVHDFLVAGIRYEPQQSSGVRLSFEVREERLYLRAAPVDPDRGAAVQQLRLFRYSVGDEAFTEIPFDLPAELEAVDQPDSRLLAETRLLHLDKTLRSPDGYRFEYSGYRGRGGLLGEIFGMGRRYDSQYVLTRDSAWYPLPDPDGNRYYYGNELSFLGWIVDEDG